MGRSNGSRFVGLLLVVALGATAWWLWFRPAETEDAPLGYIAEEPIGSGPLVVVVGDSLTVESRDELVDALDDHALLLAAISGQAWSGNAFNGPTPEDPPVVTAALWWASRQPVAVVLALGTNDAWSTDIDVGASLRQLDRVAAAYPRSCIVAVEVDETVPEQPSYDSTKASWINGRLRDVAQEVVPWNAMANDAGDLIASDGIHLTEAGEKARSRAIAEAIARCPT